MMRKILYSTLFILFLASVSGAQEFANLSAPEVNKLVDGKSKTVLVDARNGEEYLAGHIPSSINIPPQSLPILASLLPKDKKTALIFYCRGKD